MGIPDRKKRHRDDLRQKVLAAAEELFVRDGYQNVSMRRIAAKIEYSPTTIYRLFRNKAEIVDLLIAEGYRGVYQRYEEILAHRPESPLETLNLIVSEYVAFALEHPNHYRLWFSTGEVSLHEGRLQMRHGETSYQVYQAWLDRIAECQEEGLLKGGDPLELFQLIWGAVHGMISLRIQHESFEWLPLERHVEQTMALLRLGLTPGRDDASQPTT